MPSEEGFPLHSEHQRGLPALFRERPPSMAPTARPWPLLSGAQQYCAPGGQSQARPDIPRGCTCTRREVAQGVDALVEGWCLEDAPRQPRTRHGHTRLCHSTAQRPVSTAPAPWKGEGASLQPGGMRK